MSDVASNVPNPPITSNPARMGGKPCFAGTRIPVHILFDFIEDGAPLGEFLTSYPDVSREHAIVVLELAKKSAIASATAAE
jgi:uncharacterized protein (DUF433 family)